MGAYISRDPLCWSTCRPTDRSRSRACCKVRRVVVQPLRAGVQPRLYP